MSKEEFVKRKAFSRGFTEDNIPDTIPLFEQEYEKIMELGIILVDENRLREAKVGAEARVSYPFTYQSDEYWNGYLKALNEVLGVEEGKEP